MNQSRPWLRVCRRSAHNVGSACLTSACWLLWIALVATLILLATLYFRRELTVPDFLLRRLESKLEFAHLSARFGRTSFDPRGYLVLEDVRLYGSGIEEPLARAAAVRLHLDFWAVTSGDFDVSRVEVTDARLDCPAIVSPSGVSEPLVADLGATIRRDKDNWDIPDASFRAGKAFVTASVRWQLPARTGPRRQLPADLLKRYIALARQIAGNLQRTEPLEETRLHLAIVGQPQSPPRIHAELAVARLAQPLPSQLGELVAEDLRLVADTAWRPGGLDPVAVTVSAARISGPQGVLIVHPWLHTGGHLDLNPVRWHGGPVEFAAATISRGNDALAHPRATVEFDSLPTLRAELAALAENSSPVALRATVDTAAKTAELDIDATLAPAFLNENAARAAVWRKSRILARLAFSEPAALTGHVSLAPGWKLREARATAHAGSAVAYGLELGRTDAEIVIDPQRLLVEPLVFHGRSTAVHGSYGMNLKTQDYRFLLQGHFFPSSIDDWFSEWWTRLWNDFKFGQRPPDADIDVIGRWRSPELSVVYGRADIAPVALRGVPLDRLRATFFIRPEHYDFLSFDARRATLAATGGFTRHDDSGTHLPRWIAFDFRSTLPLQEGARLFGPEGARTVEPFVFANPPEIVTSGRMDWADTGLRETIHVTASAPGEFRFHEFPVQNARLAFDILDGDILVRSIAADLAGGPLTGTATVTGPRDARRMAFSGKLQQADLAGTVGTWMDYRARTAPPGTPPMPDSASELGDKGKLDLSLEASGPLENLYALQGQGEATVRGAKLADIEMFGALSRLLRGTFLGFTSLEFNDADAKFALNGEHLDFSTLRLTGPFAALKGKGRYTMPSSTLNFNVVLYPFRESNSPIYMVMGTVLMPFSHAFGIHLGGTLAKPEWSLSVGTGVPTPAPTTPSPAPAPVEPANPATGVETKPISAH
jgi:hypothetical protein